MNEPIRLEDLRMVMSVLAQTAYGTRLTDGNLTAGVSLAPKTPTMGDIIPNRIGGGPRPFAGGGEWNSGDNERFITYDSSLSLTFDLNSWLLGWIAAFFLGDITSQICGATTHYDHECHPTDPMLAAGVRDALVTSIYLDSAGPDATRFRRILQDLAIADATISGGVGDLLQAAINFVGSGIEVTNPTITIPTLESIEHGNVGICDLAGGDVTIEYGDKAGSLTDISDRISQWSLRFNQNLDAANGYYPGSGMYRGRMRFNRRTFSIELAIKTDREGRDLLDDMLNKTRKELLFTLSSPTLVGTCETHYNGGTIRYPDIRISESGLNFPENGADWAVRVGEDQVYYDVTVEDSPVAINIDNVAPYYLVAP